MEYGDCCSTINAIEVDDSTPDLEDKDAETYTLKVQVLSNSTVNICIPKRQKKKPRRRLYASRKKNRKRKPAKPKCATCGHGVVPCPLERIQKRRQFARVPTPQYEVYDYCSGKCTEEEQPKKKPTPLELAVAVQQYLRPFYTLCHGLLAGLGLGHCILARSVTNDVEMRWLLESYYLMALELHGTYYFLAVMCFLSVLDRFDLAHMDLFHIHHLVRYRALDIIIFLIYLFVLVTTNVAYGWERRMSTPLFNEVWWNDSEELFNYYSDWKTISLCRGVGAILGWICLVLSEGEDMLYLHLANIIKYQ